jgi:fructokinase
MPTVFALGETVFDIIFRNDQPVAARAGGSTLNTAVSLGRCGIPVELITETGDDEIAKIILGFLAENGVGTRYVQRYEKLTTAIALAFLDPDNNAHYSFYKQFPDERLTSDFPAVTARDVVLFGSSFAITKPIREKVVHFIRYAKEQGALILYDPNFRSAHFTEPELLRPWILENIQLSDIIRGSDEDFLNIFGVPNSGEAYRMIHENGNGMLIYTKNRMGVEFVNETMAFEVPVPSILPVSTIGAGDAFNGGVLFSLIQKNITKGSLGRMTKEDWETVINRGIRFSENVCLSYDNYVSKDLIKSSVL